MPDCNACKASRKDKNAEPVPFVAHEAEAARLHDIISKLWVFMIILIALLVGSNIAWLIHDRQYEVVVTREIEAEQTAEGGGNNVLVGGDYYGDEAESSH